MAQVVHGAEIAVPGMTARRVALAAGESVEHAAGGGEAMVYVIAGAGSVRLPDAERPLAEESLVWLAGDDAARIEAGAGGLELLLAASR
ncbi:MAG TPA: hypothetical protein VFL66_09490 [Gaiellaceae bacterium]|nr:hypothetical protein [Gaiellaceae bacterium]